MVVGLSGVYLLMKYKQNSFYFSHTYFTLPAVFAFASAASLVASGILGSWLSLRDSTFLQGLVKLCVCVWVSACASVFWLYIIKCFLLQFVYLLVVVFCLESTASALAYFHSTKVYKLHKNSCALDSCVAFMSHQIVLENNCTFMSFVPASLFSWIQRYLPSVECFRNTQAAVRTPTLELWMLPRKRFVFSHNSCDVVHIGIHIPQACFYCAKRVKIVQHFNKSTTLSKAAAYT